MTTALLAIGIALLAALLACVIDLRKSMNAIRAFMAPLEDDRARREEERVEKHAAIARNAECFYCAYYSVPDLPSPPSLRSYDEDGGVADAGREDRCVEFSFIDPRAGGDYYFGTCHRYPPVGLAPSEPDSDNTTWDRAFGERFLLTTPRKGRFPFVDIGDGCGEFLRAPVGADEWRRGYLERWEKGFAEELKVFDEYMKSRCQQGRKEES